jgi:hypothetical protein
MTKDKLVVWAITEDCTDDCTFFCTETVGLFLTKEAATREACRLKDEVGYGYHGQINVVPMTVSDS